MIGRAMDWLVWAFREIWRRRYFEYEWQAELSDRLDGTDPLDLLQPRAANIARAAWDLGEDCHNADVWVKDEGLVFIGPSRHTIPRGKLEKWFYDEQFRLIDDSIRRAAFAAAREPAGG